MSRTQLQKQQTWLSIHRTQSQNPEHHTWRSWQPSSMGKRQDHSPKPDLMEIRKPSYLLNIVNFQSRGINQWHHHHGQAHQTDFPIKTWKESHWSACQSSWWGLIKAVQPMNAVPNHPLSQVREVGERGNKGVFSPSLRPPIGPDKQCLASWAELNYPRKSDVFHSLKQS